jgi:hypothetical protein
MFVDDGPAPADFPLGVASNGQYCKRYGGKRHHFGSVNRGWRAALAKFQRDWPYILLGKPVPESAEAAAATLDYLANKFVENELGRYKRGEITAGTFLEVKNTLDLVLAHFAKDRSATTLLPDDFAQLRHALSRKWAKDDAGNWHALKDIPVGVDYHKRRIIHTRAMFKYSVANEYLAKLPRYGESFKLPPLSLLRKARRTRAREHGPKRFPKEQCPLIFHACGSPLDAMFLLSVLCGYNEIDCAYLPTKAVNLDKGFIDFDRVKTGVYRRVAIHPALADAFRRAAANRPDPAPGTENNIVYQEDGCEPVRVKDLFFLTKFGMPWSFTSVAEKDGVPQTIQHKGGIGKEFDRVLAALSRKYPKGIGEMQFKRKGISFGTGRHTFESNAKRIAFIAKDENIIDFIMGHSSGAMSQWYDHPPDDDLKAVADAVYGRLFLPDQPAESGTANVAPLRIAQ